MKQLTLLRHGKSDWSEPYVTDYERPLKARGRRDAPRMGEYMSSLGLVPDLIVSSPAVRARHTAELFAEALCYTQEIEWDEDIYGASASELIDLLRHQPSAADHIVMVGHNPGFEELTTLLTAERPPNLTGGIRLPTASAAHILLNVNDWPHVSLGCGQLAWLITPKSLPQGQE